LLNPAGLMSDRASAFHLVNDNAMDSTIGIQIRMSWINVGIATITARTPLSPADSLWEPPRLPGTGSFARVGAAGEATCALMAAYRWA
jgi:hypothetical protein